MFMYINSILEFYNCNYPSYFSMTISRGKCQIWSHLSGEVFHYALYLHWSSRLQLVQTVRNSPLNGDFLTTYNYIHNCNVGIQAVWTGTLWKRQPQTTVWFPDGNNRQSMRQYDISHGPWNHAKNAINGLIPSMSSNWLYWLIEIRQYKLTIYIYTVCLEFLFSHTFMWNIFLHFRLSTFVS